MTGAALLILFIISAFLLNAYVQNKSTKDAKPVIIRAPVKRVKKMPVEKISNPETDKKPVKQTPVKKDE
ncbi:MAG: hypothetical protein HRT89_18490 [Lentisphaeria bacterium]|nr:hypothetical protein [Lentisphaeria bacterium]